MSPYPANPKGFQELENDPNQPFRSYKPVPVNIDFTSTNTGSTTYQQLYVDVKLSYFGDLFFKCGWHSIPIPIDNIDGCKVGGNCPIKPGVNPTKVVVDLTPFAAIIEKLAANTYYRVEIRVKAGDKTTLLNCLQADFLLK